MTRIQSLGHQRAATLALYTAGCTGTGSNGRLPRAMAQVPPNMSPNTQALGTEAERQFAHVQTRFKAL